MGFLSDPVRTKPGTLIACGVGLLLLGGALGHWLRGSRSVDDQTGAGSSDLGREKPLSTAKADAAPGRPGAPTVAKLLGNPVPKLRRASLYERAQSLAKEDVDSAIAALASISDRLDRDAFLEGLFAYLGENLDPKTAVALAAELDPIDRRAALIELAAAWTDGRARTSAEPLIARFDVETGIGLALAWDEAYRAEFGEAWAEAFPDSEGIGVLLGSFAAKKLDDPPSALAMGAHLGGWDREMFLRALTAEWANRDPSAAWDWATAQEHGKFGGVRSDILRRWSNKDLAAATEALATLENAEEKNRAAAAIAQGLAYRDGTVAAVDWANALTSEENKDAAHGAIAKTAPQGIGAVLGFEDGAAVIKDLVPGGAAERGGQLQPGDRIVEVDPGTGHFEVAYGRTLEHSMDLIRGEAGSTMRMRVLRRGEDGTLEDQIISVQREQIVLQGAKDRQVESEG